MKKAFITGITGQDGSYLTELLLSKGYEVHGLVRRASSMQRARLDHLTSDTNSYGKQLFLHYSDLDDTTTIRRLLMKTLPDEVYHLAGQSHVGLSFEIPESTCEFTAMGTLKLLEIVRDLPSKPRFLNVGSSEIFGIPDHSPQNESTPMNPVTPYGVAKAFAVQMVKVYRESFDLFACNAICYNHESPRRGESFVTRKICRAAASIAAGKETEIRLGSIDAQRDWGYAPEYVEAMWRMLQQDKPEDFVLATGILSSVENFMAAAFEAVNLDWSKYYVRDERFIRPNEGTKLVGDASKAKEKLHWQATITLAQIAHRMVAHESSLHHPKQIEKQN